MPEMRFNHMELTFRGTLTTGPRGDRRAQGAFGWTGVDAGSSASSHISCHSAVLRSPNDKPMQSPGYDHLGSVRDP
jgi:hypothetical protein